MLDTVARSNLPERALFSEETPDQWNAAFRLLAEILPDDSPSVVVMDEVPYLMDRIDAFEGMLQRAWDRLLSRKPVLLLLIGSDLSMMEALNSYARPFHQRGREMVVGPLNPADIGEMLGLEPAAAFDAALVTGGLPLICAEWRPGADVWEFLRHSLDNPISGAVGLRRAITCRGVSTAGHESGGPAGHRKRREDLHQHRSRGGRHRPHHSHPSH